MHILETSLEERPFDAHGLVKALDQFKIPRSKNESTRMIRQDRDSR